MPSIKWKIFGATFGITVFTLLIQINSAEDVNRSSNTLHNGFPSSPNGYLRRHKRNVSLPPNLSFNSIKLAMIQDQLNLMQEQLAYLKSSPSLYNEDKSRISRLETAVNKMQTYLDSFQKDYSETKQIITFMTNKLETLEFDGIIQSIKFGQFSLVEKQLKLANDTIYKKIVQQVYDHQVNNIDILLRFGGSIADSEKKFILYEALYHEIKNSGNLDAQTLLRLSQSFRKGVLEAEFGAVTDKHRSFVQTLWEENRNSSVTLITSAFLDNKSWSLVKQIINEIHRSSGLKFLGDIYKQVIEKVTDKLSIEDILTKVDKNVNVTEERIIFHEEIINKMERNGSLYNNTVILLARHMKKTWDDPDFHNEDWRYRYKIIINKLPRSWKNLVLSSSLCIKNSHYNEYLYGADPGYTVDADRQVFVGLPKSEQESPEFKWEINFDSDSCFKIRNIRNNGFLAYYVDYTSNRDKYYAVTRGYRYDYIWRFTVDGEGVQINHCMYQKYLFANDETRGDNMRYAFAYASDSKPPYPIKWELVDCADIS